MMDKRTRWTDELKKLPGWISVAISFVTAVIGFALLIQGNYQLSIMIIILLALSTLFIILVYFAFAKTPPLVEGGKGVYRYQKYRPWAFLGMGIVIVLLFGTQFFIRRNREETAYPGIANETPLITVAPTGMSGSAGTPTGLPSPDAGLRIIQTLTSQNRRQVLSVSLSPDGQQIAAGFYGDPVHIWHVSDGTLLHRLEGKSAYASSVAFSMDGALLATGTQDTTVKLWQVSDGAFLRTLEGARHYVYSVAFSQDGTLLAAGSRDTVNLWRVDNGTLLHTLTGDLGNVYAVAISPDGKTVAAGGSSLKVQLWDVDSGTLIHELKTNDWVRSLAFSPDGQYLVAGEGIRASVWRVSDGSKLYDDLTGHAQSIGSIAFLPDGGETLATVSRDLAVRVWQVSNGQRLYTVEGFADGVSIMNLAPDGRTLASSEGGTVQVWQVP